MSNTLLKTVTFTNLEWCTFETTFFSMYCVGGWKDTDEFNCVVGG